MQIGNRSSWAFLAKRIGKSVGKCGKLSCSDHKRSVIEKKNMRRMLFEIQNLIYQQNQVSALAKKQSILHISFDSQKSLGQSPFRRVVSLGSHVSLATHQAPSVALHPRWPEATDCRIDFIRWISATRNRKGIRPITFVIPKERQEDRTWRSPRYTKQRVQREPLPVTSCAFSKAPCIWWHVKSQARSPLTYWQVPPVLL